VLIQSINKSLVNAVITGEIVRLRKRKLDQGTENHDGHTGIVSPWIVSNAFDHALNMSRSLLRTSKKALG
jgi:hypothetical protein